MSEAKQEMVSRTFWLEEDLDQWLKDVSEESDRSITQVIRLCIRRAREQCRPVGKALKK